MEDDIEIDPRARNKDESVYDYFYYLTQDDAYEKFWPVATSFFNENKEEITRKLVEKNDSGLILWTAAHANSADLIDGMLDKIEFSVNEINRNIGIVKASMASKFGHGLHQAYKSPKKRDYDPRHLEYVENYTDMGRTLGVLVKEMVNRVAENPKRRDEFPKKPRLKK